MKKLATFIIQSITGSEDFEIQEKQEGDFVNLEVAAAPEITGLIIGRNGKTIKSIRRILSIKAALEKKGINISVTEKTG